VRPHDSMLTQSLAEFELLLPALNPGTGVTVQ
jgi:hypothetical protein